MYDAYFEERSRIGRRTFVLTGSELKIDGEIVRVGKVDVQIDVRDLAPRFEHLRFRDFRVINRSLTYAVGIAALTGALWSAKIPGAAIVLGIGGYLALNFLWVAFRWIRPVEVERYFNHAGTLVFDIRRESPDERLFDAFTADLRRTIEDNHPGNRPNQSSQRNAVAGPAILDGAPASHRASSFEKTARA